MVGELPPLKACTLFSGIDIKNRIWSEHNCRFTGPKLYTFEIEDNLSLYSGLPDMSVVTSPTLKVFIFAVQ